MVIFVRVQGRRKFQPQEYIEYFEDLSASGGLKFEPDAEIGQKVPFCEGLVMKKVKQWLYLF